MRALLVLLLFALCLYADGAKYVPGTPGAEWTEEEMLIMKAKLWRLFDTSQSGHITWEWKYMHHAKDPDPKPSLTSRPVPLTLRMSFHDCLKYTDNTGGCDGCLNFQHGSVGNLNGPWYQLQLDLADVSPNNGLQDIVKILEEMYVNGAFPSKTPQLATSLRDSGKSRADWWAFCGIAAVEYAIETNNGVCDDANFEVEPGYTPSRWDWARMDPSNGGAHCNHAQGEPGCRVEIPRRIVFKHGRKDCITPDGGYDTSKEERHPDPHTNGEGTVAYFTNDFGFNGREIVAILGAHTLGRLHMGTTMLPYVWIKSGGQMFNNQYYRNLVKKPAWFWSHAEGTKNGCTKQTDAWGEKGQARWLANARLHLKTGGPAFWIQEKLICKDLCIRDDGRATPKRDEACCGAGKKPAGAQCKPDADRPRGSNATAEDNNVDGGCERFKFHVGLDECMLNVDMGLYKQFGVQNGIPYGCVGLEDFNLNEWRKSWKAGTTFQSHWSKINGRRAEPECPYNKMEVGGSAPLHEIIEEFADHQDKWIEAFVPTFEKMLENGYAPGELTEGIDQYTGVECPRVIPNAATKAQWAWACTRKFPWPTPAPPTPAPDTPAPDTPAPATPAPDTPAPDTPVPDTPVPATPAPDTPAPDTPAPATPAPDTPAPATSAPATPAPGTPSPDTPAPETSAPDTPAPATSAPETPAPGIDPSSTTAPPVSPGGPTTSPATAGPTADGETGSPTGDASGGTGTGGTGT
eukprot:Hpha_TRINITY_DN15778_c1_g3::TRINITY_DN15778_c1_g3_i1::g.40632::m.40632